MSCVYNQEATGTVSIHTLFHLLKTIEHLWICLENSDFACVNQLIKVETNIDELNETQKYNSFK
uniref:Uncharacterized protein n=1 Tax=Arion vulgaris TaxID=1028688 RepID=A0A0B6Y2E0_9EUPU